MHTTIGRSTLGHLPQRRRRRHPPSPARRRRPPPPRARLWSGPYDGVGHGGGGVLGMLPLQDGPRPPWQPGSSLPPPSSLLPHSEPPPCPPLPHPRLMLAVLLREACCCALCLPSIRKKVSVSLVQFKKLNFPHNILHASGFIRRSDYAELII